MDANTLRLILIVVGGLLLIGLYIWERRRARPDEDEPYEEEDLEEDKLEPQLGAWHGGEDEEGRRAATSGMRERHTPYPEPEQPELHLEPPESPPEESESEGPESPLILSFHIAPKEGTFDGEAIVHAASRCGIEPGEMDVFHRFSDLQSTKTPLFSMANMVKPGTFPFGAMAEFESPGLTLFSQAEGAVDDPERLEAMLSTAHCLAEELDGEILDGTRSALTPEAEKRLRDQVLELVAWRLSDTDEE
jgi:cell division protein ZipA